MPLGMRPIGIFFLLGIALVAAGLIWTAKRGNYHPFMSVGLLVLILCSGTVVITEDGNASYWEGPAAEAPGWTHHQDVVDVSVRYTNQPHWSSHSIFKVAGGQEVYVPDGMSYQPGQSVSYSCNYEGCYEDTITVIQKKAVGPGMIWWFPVAGLAIVMAFVPMFTYRRRN